MEAIFIYFLKANGLLVTFFLTYYFLLRKETFFNKNRWFLLLGLLASVLLPLITFTKTILVDPSPVIYETFSNDFIPYIIENKVIEEPIDWKSILFYAYLVISAVFIVNILVEILSFFRIIKFGKRTKTNEAILIDNESNENPFSFFNYIVFNSQMFSEDELQHIISHENIHVKEKHSIDVLVAKMFSALFWVNPIMWFYQKEMLQNLEYIADDKASTIAQDKINYQKTLLKVVTNQHQLSITNQFYQSLIKKRIVMLNTNPSNQRKSWKYALILPVLSAFMLLFQVETVAQVKAVPVTSEKAAYAVEVIQFIIDKSTTNEEIKKETERLKKEYDVEIEISKIKRNKQNEIIALDAKFVDANKTTGKISIKGDEAIEPILFYKELGENGKIGFDRSNMSTVFAKIDSNNDNIKSVGISWDEAVKLNDEKTKKDKLYIINGKEYLQSEIPKETIVIVDGKISELDKEEGIKKYGQKAKDGVLIFNGNATFAKKDENEVPKNLKINFEKGKTYIIEGHKATYDELKDKNLFIYTGSKYSITEKDNVVTINGDIVEDAEMWNNIEVIDSNPKKVNEAKYLNFDNGDILVYYNNSLKIPGEPAYSLDTYKFYINDEKISKKDFINLIDLKYSRYKFLDNSKTLKFYTNPLPNNKTFTLSNGHQVVVIENNRIKIPEYPTTTLGKVSLFFNEKNISESDFIKMNYNDIKSIKVVKQEGTSGKDLKVKEIYFYSK